jgi:hypothetical protein
MKSHGLGLCITGPWLALGPWCTRDHGATSSLRGFGGQRDSSKREREVDGVLTNDATLRQSCGDDHTTALNRGDR